MDIIAAVSRVTATNICRYPRAHATDIPLATGTHFIKSGLLVCPVFPYRAVYSSKTSTLRWFTQFMQFMQNQAVYAVCAGTRKTGPVRSARSDLVCVLIA